MINLLLHLVLISICVSCLAQNPIAGAPDLFGYQGVARDDQGNPLVNQSISLKISILEGSTSGTVSYSETHSVTIDEYGMFDIMVGGGIAVTNTMADIKWGQFEHFIKVEMDETGTGTTYQLMGTTQLVSVPYAKYAQRSGHELYKMNYWYYDEDDCTLDNTNDPESISIIWDLDRSGFWIILEGYVPYYVPVTGTSISYPLFGDACTLTITNGQLSAISCRSGCDAYGYNNFVKIF